MSRLYIILIATFLTLTFTLKTKLTLSTGDLCLQKPVHHLGQQLYITAIVKSDAELKNLVSMVVEYQNRNIFNINSVSQINEILNTSSVGDHKICFKPIFEDPITIEYEINTDVEQLEMRKVADKKAFEDVKQDLDILKEQTDNLSDSIRVIGRERFEHFKSK